MQDVPGALPENVPWYENWKTYLVLSILVPAAITLAIYLVSRTVFNTLIYGLFAFISVPIAFEGVYMMTTGGAYRFLNIGIDWTKVGEEKARNVSSHYGIFMVICGIGLMVGLSFMVSMRFAIGITLLVISIVIVLIPLAFSKKMLDTPRRRYTNGTAVLLVVLCTVLTAVPAACLGTTGDGVSVTVEMNDDSFTVKAPMFDHTFRYSDVSHIEIVDDFDFGSRMFGYAGANIVSGKWHNGSFGDYELAAFRSNHRCIAISVGGSMYAFNKESAADTTALFDQLNARI